MKDYYYFNPEDWKPKRSEKMTEKNFEKVEAGQWYLRKDKVPVLCTETKETYAEFSDGTTRYVDGKLYIGDHDENRTLTLHIKSPVIEPILTPKKKIQMTVLCWVLPEYGFISHNKTAPTNSVYWKRFPAGDITGEIEE